MNDVNHVKIGHTLAKQKQKAKSKTNQEKTKKRTNKICNCIKANSKEMFCISIKINFPRKLIDQILIRKIVSRRPKFDIPRFWVRFKRTHSLNATHLLERCVCSQFTEIRTKFARTHITKSKRKKRLITTLQRVSNHSKINFCDIFYRILFRLQHSHWPQPRPYIACWNTTVLFIISSTSLCAAAS